jgi:O-antigen ligase
MTATAPRPTFTSPSPDGPRRSRPLSTRTIVLIGLAVVGAVVLGYLGQSLLAVGVIAGVVVGVVAVSFLRNDADLIMPALIYSMWFEGLAFGQISVGRVMALLVPVVIALRMVTSSWKPPAFEPRAWLPVAVMTIWAVSGAFYAASGLAPWAQSLGTFMLGVAYYLGAATFQKGPQQIETLLRRWVWIGVPIALAGLVIFFTLGNRIFGLTGGPNTYAAYIQMLIPLLVVFARRESGARQWMYWALIPVFLGAVLSSGSRGGLIGTGVVGLYVLFTLPRVRPSRRVIVAVVGLVSMVGVFLLFGVLSPDRFSIGAILSSKGTGRIEIWHAALQVLRGHWVFGLGLGGFSPNAIVLIQNTNNVDLSILQNKEVVQQGGIVAQNLYLQIMLDMGIIGMVMYIGIISTTLKNLWDIRKTEWGDLSWAFGGALLGGLVAGMFASQYNQKFVWLIIGLAASNFVRRRLTAPHGARASVPLVEPAA